MDLLNEAAIWIGTTLGATALVLLILYVLIEFWELIVGFLGLICLYKALIYWLGV